MRPWSRCAASRAWSCAGTSPACRPGRARPPAWTSWPWPPWPRYPSPTAWAPTASRDRGETMPIDVNLDNVEAWKGGAVLPPGHHLVRCTDAEEGRSSGGHPELHLTWEATAGEHAGG